MDIVPFEEKHVPLFTRWFNALPHNDVWTEDWVRHHTLDDADYDPELMIAAERDGEPVGFALGSVGRGAGWIKAFIVDPAQRKQGIATALFDALEERFRARDVGEINVGYALPRYFLPGIDLAYTDAIVFLDRRGYKTTRETRVNMDVRLTGSDLDTAAKEEQLRQKGFAVRRATRDDEASVTVLCQDEGHLGWIVETVAGLGHDPASVFVAEREGKILAFATHSVIGPTHFGPMLTAAELRGLGIGSVLLKRCLRDWQEAGYEACEIIWAGPLSFYARSVGATVGKAFWTYRKQIGEG